MKASDNEFPKLLLAVQASAAATPSTGLFAVYAKSDGLYYVDDAGVEHAVGSGAGGTWGSITGTLSDQADLQTALDAKLADAPSDGTQYARQSGAWAAVSASGGTWGTITGTLSSQTDLQAALDAKATKGQLAGINDQTGTTYTLVLSDAGKDVRCTNSAAVTLTIPPNSSVAFPVGTILNFSQGGTGTVTASAGTGVTLNAASGFTTSAQYDVRALEQVATDVWRVV